MYVYLNNRMLNAEEARISVLDRGFAYGDSLFETIKMIEGRPVFFNEHMDRLKTGMEAAGFALSPEPEKLRQQALSLARENGVQLGRLRILVTRGAPRAPAGPDPSEETDPTVLVTVQSYAPEPSRFYREGVSCVTVPANRGRYASLKSACLLGSILTRKEARDQGAWEALYTDGHGAILEGVYTNVFFLEAGTLVTAPTSARILPGVTRQKIIEEASALGLPVDMRAVKAGELGPGVSAFLTGSLLGVCPVREIDGRALAPDPGPVNALKGRLEKLERKSAGL